MYRVRLVVAASGVGIDVGSEGLAQGNPKIEQAKTGDDTADRAQADKGVQAGGLREERVSLPRRGIPGCETNEKAKVDPDDDAQKALDLLEPIWNSLRSVRCGGRRCGHGCLRQRLRCRIVRRGTGRTKRCGEFWLMLLGHQIGSTHA